MYNQDVRSHALLCFRWKTFNLLIWVGICNWSDLGEKGGGGGHKGMCVQKLLIFIISYWIILGVFYVWKREANCILMGIFINLNDMRTHCYRGIQIYQVLVVTGIPIIFITCMLLMKTKGEGAGPLPWSVYTMCFTMYVCLGQIELRSETNSLLGLSGAGEHTMNVWKTTEKFRVSQQCHHHFISVWGWNAK